MSVGYRNGGQARQNQPSSAQGGSGPGWDGIKDEVGQAAGQVASQVADRGREFIDAAREQATGYVDQRKNEVAQSVEGVARSLREALGQFDDRPNIAAFVDGAAGGLEQLAGTIRERSFNEIFADVEEVMRRRPATVAAATMAAGFLLARFIKSSAEGIRAAEEERRRTSGPRSGEARRARAQASPGSAYAQSGA